MTPEALRQILGSIIILQLTTILVLSFLGIAANNPFKRGKRTKKVALDDKSLYNIVNTLLEYCVQKKDNEGAMLITAFGKHLYDKKLKK